jgi:PAS domain S-box-containing protein
MRIESFAAYKYFFQLIKEEPKELRRYSLFLILIPLFVVCYLYDWNTEILLFLSFGYLSASVGFLTAFTNNRDQSVSFKKQYYHQLISENSGEMIMLVSNKNNKILFANPAFYNRLGFIQESKSTILLEDIFDIQEPPHLRKNQFLRDFKKRELNIQPISRENEVVQIKNRNGELLWIKLSTKKVGDGGVFTLYQLTEVTEKVMLEKATSQFAKDLLQRKSALKALKRKEAEVILMMNLERTKLNS